MGGENVAALITVIVSLGSSPRGRGKRKTFEGNLLPLGLIPAWAGKTHGVLVDSHGLRAHPRVGGENGGA